MTNEMKERIKRLDELEAKTIELKRQQLMQSSYLPLMDEETKKAFYKNVSDVDEALNDIRELKRKMMLYH